MSEQARARWPELLIAWIAAAGVATTGTLDFVQGQAPRGVFDLDAGAGLAFLLTSCLLTALLMTANAFRPPPSVATWHRVAVLLVALVPAVVGDPTYGSLLLAAPLVDLRRREDEPVRTGLTLAAIAAVTSLLLTEQSPRDAAEFEAMFGLMIAFLIIVMFGDALRQVDRALETETALASLTERSRLSEELHDSVGHHLLAASVQLQKAGAIRDRDPVESERSVDLAGQAVAAAISETRLIVAATRPGKTFALEPALRELSRRIVPSGTAITVDVHGDHANLGSDEKVALYRVAQEALTNVVRHSAATTARIASHAAVGDVRLEISDNGRGFDPDEVHRAGGVQNMRGRIEAIGGEFNIVSTADGTSVMATVPT